jgi:hypothetical protein
MRFAALVLLLAMTITRPATAQVGNVYPVYAEMPGSNRNEPARKLFAGAATHEGLGPVETIGIAAPPAARAPELLKTGMAAAEKLKFAEAESALDAAVAEVLSGGGSGLSQAELANLFLYQAIAAQRATWRELEAPPTEIAPPKAKEAYLRAAVLAPDRVLEPHRYPPLAIASFAVAVAEVKQRPRGNIVVRARPSATINVDGGPDQLAPATAIDLPYGEHFVRVEDVGHAPWSAVVSLALPSLDIDAPVTAPLVPDDKEAAAHAKRMGAAYALLSFLKLGPKPELELHLIDAASGERRDASVVPFAGEAGALDAAVMHLDEEARKLSMAAAPAMAVPATDLTVAAVPAGPPAAAPAAEPPGLWARKHWPLLTAIGAAVGTALVLSFAVASDSRAPR